MNYTIEIHRLEPPVIKGQKISGLLETIQLGSVPQKSIPDLIEHTAVNYGGGKFQIKMLVDGKYVKSQTFEIAGIPKGATTRPCNCPIQQLMLRGCQNTLHI